jgi:hypothetical protein
VCEGRQGGARLGGGRGILAVSSVHCPRQKSLYSSHAVVVLSYVQRRNETSASDNDQGQREVVVA